MTRNQNLRSKTTILATCLVAGITLSGCGSGIISPVVKVHGYQAHPGTVESLEVGLQTKREVERVLGTPSTTAEFNGETWYYISSTISQYAWEKPKVIDRIVFAVNFNDENNTIAQIDHYGIEDGRIVNFSNRVTPTRGRELTFLEQLFGNVGRVSSSVLENQTGGGR